MENWKDIAGFEGRYRVSDLGRVRNALGRVLRPNNQKTGYHIFHLYSGGRHTRIVRLGHRLVALAFLGDPIPGQEVNHKNGVKQDNKVDNLEWVTRAENIQHAVKHGLAGTPRCAVLGVSILDGSKVFYCSQSAAEKELAGRNTSAVHHCLEGKLKSAYGYAWSRA